MKDILVKVPEEILISLKETQEEFGRLMLMSTAIRLYQAGKLSSGRAAQLAGISRIEFLDELAKNQIPLCEMTEEELKRDIENAKEYHM